MPLIFDDEGRQVGHAHEDCNMGIVRKHLENMIDLADDEGQDITRDDVMEGIDALLDYIIKGSTAQLEEWAENYRVTG